MKTRKGSLDAIANDKISPSLVSDIKVRSLYYGEVNRVLKLKLINKDLDDLARRLLNKVTVLRDLGCWVVRDDWSVYASFEDNIAHRLSYTLFVDDILPGNVICHKCDRKGCINFDHLFQGTHSDNRIDFIIKYKEYMLGRKFGNVTEVIPWNQIKKVLEPKIKRHKEMPDITLDLAGRLRKITG